MPDASGTTIVGPAANPREHGVILKPFGIVRQSAYAVQCRIRHCTATTPGSDFPPPYIIGYDSSSSRCGPGQRTAADQTRDLPASGAFLLRVTCSQTPAGRVMPRITALLVLRSAISTDSAPATCLFRGSITHPTQLL